MIEHQNQSEGIGLNPIPPLHKLREDMTYGIY